tara:strand:+ start:44 stop:343 length:300 start_codon:yes stop_codon:yes gene_type:complete
MYPIWNKIVACIYKGNKSYGVRETGETTICVGSSAKNSHDFLFTKITKRHKEIEGQKCVIFAYSVDNVVLKKMIFTETNHGTAGEPIKTVSKLKQIKSL